MSNPREATRWRSARLTAVAVAAALSTMASGHDDPRHVIHTLTHRIAATPDDPALHVRRGEEYRQLRQWPEALADFDAALRLDPEGAEDMAFRRARVLHAAGRDAEAQTQIEQFLAARPEDGGGHLLRARILAQRQCREDAAAAYEAATRRLERRVPQIYLEWASVVERAGGDGRAAALDVIEAGRRDLGPIVSLEIRALDLEVALGRYSAALGRLDRLQRRARRPERWLVRRGDVLRAAGRPAAARAAYGDALAAIDALPSRHRTVRATQALRRRAEEGRRRAGVESGAPLEHDEGSS